MLRDCAGAYRCGGNGAPSVDSGGCCSRRRLYVLMESLDGPVLRTVIAPNGTVYRSTGALAVNPVTLSGWYTVQIDTQSPGVEQIFTAELGLVASLDCGSTPGR